MPKTQKERQDNITKKRIEFTQFIEAEIKNTNDRIKKQMADISQHLKEELQGMGKNLKHITVTLDNETET